MTNNNNGKFKSIHKNHKGFQYDSIQCLGFYCEQCNEFFIISGQSKVKQIRIFPKVINKELVS